MNIKICLWISLYATVSFVFWSKYGCCVHTTNTQNQHTKQFHTPAKSYPI